MKEIERKFLLEEDGRDLVSPAARAEGWTPDELRAEARRGGVPIRQGYLTPEDGRNLAVALGLAVSDGHHYRIRRMGDAFFLTMKGEGDLVREEIEVEIEEAEFEAYWPLTAGRRVEKLRFERTFGGVEFEVDVFVDRDLILAEHEGSSESAVMAAPAPGREVTTDRRYRNSVLAK